MIQLHFKIILSSITWTALGYSLLLLSLTFFLTEINFVIEIQVNHVKGIYEVGFPLFAIFLFSQLFSEEIEEGMLKWILSMPMNHWVYLFERWFVGLGILLIIYTGSILLINYYLLSIPLDEFFLHVLLPSLLLGHVAMLVTILGRSVLLGMAIPLFYWIFESLSLGILTKQLFLFQATFPIPNVDLGFNRLLLCFTVIVLWIMSGWILSKRAYFLK